jgi:hypothetical protein
MLDHRVGLTEPTLTFALIEPPPVADAQHPHKLFSDPRPLKKPASPLFAPKYPLLVHLSPTLHQKTDSQQIFSTPTFSGGFDYNP